MANVDCDSKWMDLRDAHTGCLNQKACHPPETVRSPQNQDLGAMAGAAGAGSGRTFSRWVANLRGYGDARSSPRRPHATERMGLGRRSPGTADHGHDVGGGVGRGLAHGLWPASRRVDGALARLAIQLWPCCAVWMVSPTTFLDGRPHSVKITLFWGVFHYQSANLTHCPLMRHALLFLSSIYTYQLIRTRLLPD